MTPTQPRLGIVTVSYRSADHVEELLASVAEHAPDAVVVVVDNSGDPATAGACAEDVDRTGRTSYLDPNANLGYAAGVNVGVRRCGDVDVVLVVNPDVVLTVDPRVLTHHLEEPGVLAVTGVLAHGGRPWTPGAPPANAHPAPSVGRELIRSVVSYSRAYRWRRPLTSPTPVEQADGAYLVMRRSTFDTLGGLDERFELYYEDVDLADRIRRRGRLLMAPVLVGRHAGARSARRSEGMAYTLLSVSRVRYYRVRGLGRWPGLLAAATSGVEYAVRTATRRPEGDAVRWRTLRAQLREARHPGSVWLLGPPRPMTPPAPWDDA